MTIKTFPKENDVILKCESGGINENLENLKIKFITMSCGLGLITWFKSKSINHDMNKRPHFTGIIKKMMRSRLNSIFSRRNYLKKMLMSINRFIGASKETIN